jgi:hypothetical protein
VSCCEKRNQHPEGKIVTENEELALEVEELNTALASWMKENGELRAERDQAIARAEKAASEVERLRANETVLNRRNAENAGDCARLERENDQLSIEAHRLRARVAELDVLKPLRVEWATDDVYARGEPEVVGFEFALERVAEFPAIHVQLLHRQVYAGPWVASGGAVPDRMPSREALERQAAEYPEIVVTFTSDITDEQVAKFRNTVAALQGKPVRTQWSDTRGGRMGDPDAQAGYDAAKAGHRFESPTAPANAAGRCAACDGATVRCRQCRSPRHDPASGHEPDLAPCRGCNGGSYPPRASTGATT